VSSCGVTSPDGAILPFRAKPVTLDLLMPLETGALKISDFGKMIVADRFWLVTGDQIFDLTWAGHEPWEAAGCRWSCLAFPRGGGASCVPPRLIYSLSSNHSEESTS
jgi:hypothetical protein